MTTHAEIATCLTVARGIVKRRLEAGKSAYPHPRFWALVKVLAEAVENKTPKAITVAYSNLHMAARLPRDQALSAIKAATPDQSNAYLADLTGWSLPYVTSNRPTPSTQASVMLASSQTQWRPYRAKRSMTLAEAARIVGEAPETVPSLVLARHTGRSVEWVERHREGESR